ncbi:I78 family peptidase inhibitor [Roseovarius aquimarinus]|uniref:I78 family peptidase inhibitor n=1 Tax=Roseovarius aquimarinus TaxID=1229156 RepID=A0ABW7I7I4_9RHOB
MQRRSTAALILPAALALAACGGGAPGAQRGAEPVFTPAATDSCGATAYSDRIGKDHKAFDFSAPDRPLRIIGPDMAMTMDYNPARLNVDIDGQGRITRIWCG